MAPSDGNAALRVALHDVRLLKYDRRSDVTVASVTSSVELGSGNCCACVCFDQSSNVGEIEISVGHAYTVTHGNARLTELVN